MESEYYLVTVSDSEKLDSFRLRDGSLMQIKMLSRLTSINRLSVKRNNTK